ncbi:MAG: hypothetical protein LBK07_03025 [Tannerella sp.]|jgi:hypothetical protein|nr:hypothetical protein [Tannerella sp.]
MVKKTFLTIAIVAFGLSAFAQKIEEVTLTVSGDGATKKEATEVALRSAIEQAFGVFVSANTQILNDELVKDEIATVSSGNIKKYEEIATVALPNGNTVVTLKAVVSVSKLISYAQSKGSSAEFAGATFGMNMKLKELNKANEEKAVANMCLQLDALAPTMFDYELELGEPVVMGSNYVIPAEVYVIYNENTELANKILINTLTALSLSEKEQEEYRTLNLPMSEIYLYYQYSNHLDAILGRFQLRNFWLRSKKSGELLCRYIIELQSAVINFEIIDNINNASSILYNLYRYESDKRQPLYSGLISNAFYRMPPTVEVRPSPFDNSFISPYLFVIPHLHPKARVQKGKKNSKYPANKCYEVHIDLTIPQTDITKYNNFTIAPKRK